MRRIVPGLIALLWVAAAPAANNLQFGPPAAWVKPVAPPTTGKVTQAASKILVLDYQLELLPKTVKYYVESVVRIQTPEGLNKLGTLTLAWNPDMDVLTVHKVRIIRDGKVTNLLASGQKFTVAKRETKLDYATLDDTLTAILQPADLRVGDTLEVAYTVDITDPVLAGHPAAEIDVPFNLPISDLHVRALWPTSEPIRWRAARGLSGIHEIRAGDMSGISLTMRHVQPIMQPKDAPLRFLVQRRIDFTSFRSWAGVARLFAPLYAKAAQLKPGSPLSARIARIRALTHDPDRRAALALQLVENDVRYVALLLGQGGLVPANVGLTWSRRFGDCKAKTALLLALLHALKIKAQPILVNTVAGGGMNRRLPMVLFNHVLVRATIRGKTYWLDGTRVGDHSLDHLHTPYYHWGLPLTANGAHLVKMVPRPRARAVTHTMVRIDASAGIAERAPFHVQTSLRGATGVLMKLAFANFTSAQLDAVLRRYWLKQYDFVHVKSVSATYDEHAHEERISMDGTAKMDWSSGQYEADVLGAGYHADFTRQRGPNRNAPYAVPYPMFKQVTETIELPDRGKGFTVSGTNLDRTVAGIQYQRHASIQNGSFVALTSQRSVAPEFPAAQAVKDQKALRKLDKSKLYLDAPTGQSPTTAERAWGLSKAADSASSFANNAWLLTSHHKYKAALDDIDTALEYDAKYPYALAFRGLLYVDEDRDKRAARSFHAALAVDPKSETAYLGLGEMAYDTGDYRAAIAALTTALGIHPKDAYALDVRALAYLRTRRWNKALTDLSAAIKELPEPVLKGLDLYWTRAVAWQLQGRTAEALDQAKRVEAGYRRSPLAYFTAAAIYRMLHQSQRAHEALKRGLALTPTAGTHLKRATYRSWSDFAGRRRDIEVALKALPTSPVVLMTLAQVQQASGQYDAAIRSLSQALASIRNIGMIVGEPASMKALIPSIFALRAVAYEKAGKTTLAQRDLATAQRKARDPIELSHVCLRLAATGVYLQDALADCNAALAKEPYQPSFLAYRGLALMQLGRYDEAIASYDSALRSTPAWASSLYGRGICELRTGKRRAGDADITLAKLMSPMVAGQFATMGIRP